MSVSAYVALRLFLEELTLTTSPAAVDCRTCDLNIVNQREDTLTPNPRPILVANGAIVQNRSLVKPDAAAMHTAGKLQLLWVEVVPT